MGADLVADPALALMGGDQPALMAPDPSVHQGASAVLLLATTAPPRSAQTEVLHRSQRSQGSALSTTGRRPCTGGRPVCADASLSPLCADGSEPGRGGRGGGRGRG